MPSSRLVPPISSFPLEMTSLNFVIHYGLRNPSVGAGRGVEGVRDPILILTYLDALERLYHIMTNPPWSRPQPVVDASTRTHVFVINEGAETSHESISFARFAPGSPPEPVPFIILPCRNAETTTHGEICRAAAEAVHEATHVFNYTERRYDTIMADKWRWFDEGFAIFMETLVISGNPDYVRYLLNWIDMPETSLDHDNAIYQAGMFVRYLARRFGNNFVNDVWVNSDPRDTPLEAIQRFLPAGEVLVTPDPHTPDIFASGYCLDPYFLWDHQSASLAPDIFARYGERAISESIELRPTRAVVRTKRYFLDHLSCRYYRFYLKDGASSACIDLLPEARQGNVMLKAEVAAVTITRRRVNIKALFPVSGATPRLSATINLPNPSQNHPAPNEIDHLVLVVSNCGTRQDMDDGTDEHDDGVGFTVEASAW